jgi:hypothetical protein
MHEHMPQPIPDRIREFYGTISDNIELKDFGVTPEGYDTWTEVKTIKEESLDDPSKPEHEETYVFYIAADLSDPVYKQGVQSLIGREDAVKELKKNMYPKTETEGMAVSASEETSIGESDG